MKFAEKRIVVERCGVQMKYTIGELVLTLGPTHPVVMAVIGNVLLGLPVAFSTNRKDLIFGEEESNNGFIRGHEIGHLSLGHLDGIEKGILVDVNKEIGADQYAISNGYCNVLEAIDYLSSIREKIKSGPFGWLKRIILFKSYNQLTKRIRFLWDGEFSNAES